ncbi:MAG: thioredoxin [Sphingobacteriales bacterium]|nr:MAG: thioredoxin [Sphingobacteriales bacterium]
MIMKKLVLFFIALLSSLVFWAQGILFETGTFAAALDKAKQENKIVFLDVYTTWCGPCKQMAANLFPTAEAGKLYNKHFVNYKIDAEKGEGIEVAATYKVQGYPTNLFLKPDGSVVYTVMGAGDLAWFLENANVAIAESKDPLQWSDYEARLNNSKTDKEFLKNYLVKGKRLGKNTDKGLDLYVEKYMGKKIKDADILFLLDYNQTMDNKAYTLLDKNKASVNKVKAAEVPDFFKYYTESLVPGTIEKLAEQKNEAGFKKVILGYVSNNSSTPKMDSWFYAKAFYERLGDETKMEVFKLLRTNEMMNTDLTEFQKEDTAKLAAYLMTVKHQLDQNKVSEAEQKEYVERFKKQNPQVTKMASLNAATDLNEMAWNVYETNNKQMYKDAIKWSEKSLMLFGGTDAVTRVSLLDTYARLLYRNGQKAEAMKQQSQALDLAKSANNSEVTQQIEASLQQMKEGSL